MKAGGVHMPPKADPHDWTTPSGQVPVVVPLGMWRELQERGFDMRWYVASRPMPKTSK